MFYRYASKKPIEIKDVPIETTHLTIYPNYYHPLNENCLPKSIIKLTIERYYYDLPLLNIPESIITLELIICGEIAINSIPPWIKILVIDCPHQKSKPIENLPQTLETLVINEYRPESKKIFKKIPFNCVVVDEYGRKII